MEVAGSAETLVILYHTEGLHILFTAIFSTYSVTFGGPALLAEWTDIFIPLVIDYSPFTSSWLGC